jgi:hypothetical protein
MRLYVFVMLACVLAGSPVVAEGYGAEKQQDIRGALGDCGPGSAHPRLVPASITIINGIASAGLSISKSAALGGIGMFLGLAGAIAEFNEFLIGSGLENWHRCFQRQCLNISSEDDMFYMFEQWMRTYDSMEIPPYTREMFEMQNTFTGCFKYYQDLRKIFMPPSCNSHNCNFPYQPK